MEFSHHKIYRICLFQKMFHCLWSFPLVAEIGLDVAQYTVREGEVRSLLVTVRVLAGELSGAVRLALSTAALSATGL